MNKQLLKRALKQVAERAVPADVDLWPAIRAQLDLPFEGDIAMNSLPVRQKRFRLIALSSLAALAAVVVLFATPWGRAFAQSIFKFFAVAPGTSFPLPTEEIALYNVAPTVAPTFAAQLEPVSTATPSKATYPSETEEATSSTSVPFVQTPVAGCADAFASLSYRCQVSRAEAAVGFDIKEPPGDLRGLTFTSAEANPTLQRVLLTYTAIGGGSQLSILQARGNYASSSWGEVPPNADVQKVTVNGKEGEYVQGTFVVKPGATSAVWEPDAPVRRLRWREGDMWFQVRLDGHVVQIEYLEKDTLIELAESLTYAPNTAEDQLRADYLTSVKDAEALAGFDLKEPTLLPEGFAFRYAQYDAASHRVRLVYEYGDSSGIAGIVIFVQPATSEVGGDGEAVQIGTVTGYYTTGSYEGSRSQGLSWTSDGLQIGLYLFTSQWYGGRLDKDDMTAIAESMK